MPDPRHILIAGPTASGKSALALALARDLDGIVVNADALQVYDNWRILSARPSLDEEALAPHALYGHVAYNAPYSVGAWLRDVAPLLAQDKRLIIVGGTGLYLSSLTRGLAEIPPTPDVIRAEGDRLRASGPQGFLDYLATHDPALLARIDRNNPMRLQRAWEVHRATGKPLSAWQEETPSPLLSLDNALGVVLNSAPDVLAKRIEARFRQMIDLGALNEVAAMRGRWDPALPSSKALGAAELMAHLAGEMPLETALERSVIATRQFAKRQRTWFRSNMKDWLQLDIGPLEDMKRTVTSVL
ncbi:tRNA (adenosine(37)-N6)-dimethylallyltransferase MiaA [Oceanibium sediminis]|uniref:tRNA (adenosine(37)-N6)-dimethylallyltransferase MiaA n=1 Tax=Oceanibium sediminis TaxID=2026339 RepID=UPI001E3BCD61|nr:tRNA (adenosine(37)-N6)-dimethylallyltransferase MiaA [Oceanibium sediminis]